MRNIKVIKVKGYRLWVMGVVMVALIVSVPTMAQFSSNQNSEFSNPTVAPSTTFQSTSSLSGSGSAYSSNPTIGDDGTAGDPNAADPQQANARRISTRHNVAESPTDNPVGDVLLPLLALAIVYGVKCMVYRRRRA